MLMPSLLLTLLMKQYPYALFRKSPGPTLLLETNASFEGYQWMLNHSVYFSVALPLHTLPLSPG